jgi:hypothetical protein
MATPGNKIGCQFRKEKHLNQQRCKRRRRDAKVAPDGAKRSGAESGVRFPKRIPEPRQGRQKWVNDAKGDTTRPQLRNTASARCQNPIVPPLRGSLFLRRAYPGFPLPLRCAPGQRSPGAIFAKRLRRLLLGFCSILAFGTRSASRRRWPVSPPSVRRTVAAQLSFRRAAGQKTPGPKRPSRAVRHYR